MTITPNKKLDKASGRTKEGRFAVSGKEPQTFSGEIIRKKFATQMDAELLKTLRQHTKSEGRHLQAVLEDAVRAYLKDKQGYQMHSDVKAAYEHSLKRYSKVYEALAK